MKKISYGKFFLIFMVFSILISISSHAQTSINKIKEQEKLVLPESLTERELKFLGSHDHQYHAGGIDHSKNHIVFMKCSSISKGHYIKLMDQAWTVMLFKQGIISLKEAQTVLTGLEKIEDPGTVSGEEMLKKLLDGDEYHASIPQLGRTKQEPMSRMQLRDKQLDVIDATHAFLRILLETIEKHSETIMPSMTHMAHAQVTTYGAYLLALYDEISRGLEFLELAYNHTNENSGGCGATSGTGWPVDRYLVTDLLGFDKLLEPTYAGEASQDWAMNTLFALSNIALTISRTAMDHGIWGMDGVNTHEVSWENRGKSSLMPQKAHTGSAWERIRIAGNNVLGATTTGMMGLHGEPYGDVLPSYQASYLTSTSGAIGALCEVEHIMIFFSDLLNSMMVDKEKLLNEARDGWGCTPDLAVKLIRDKGYASRQAHRICAVMVRIARHHRNIKPYELTGAMLDEAARVSNDPEPHLTTEEIREIMDPAKFIERHNNTGDPHPKETERMIKIRHQQIKESIQQQQERRERVEKGYEMLRKEINQIIQ